jgi:hypothetical protein
MQVISYKRIVSTKQIMQGLKGKLPREPTVREALLFQTGAPELVVQKGELKALAGRYYT